MKPLRIGIDARWISGSISGIGQYTRELILALALLEGEEQYLLFFSDPLILESVRSDLGSAASRFEFILGTKGPFHPCGQWWASRAARKRALDVFHSPNFMLPLFPCGAARVATVHDLIPLKYPEFTPRAKKTRYYPVFRMAIRRSVRSAEMVLVVSECSKRDLVDEFGLPETQVAVVHNGVGERFFRMASLGSKRSFRDELDIRGPLVLYVGRRDPYKNLSGLLRAHAEIAKQGNGEEHLVVAGETDPRYPEAEKMVGQLGLSRSVHFTGYLSDPDLLALYSEADLLVIPSLYEGFGLQALEAFAAGVPVVASDAASIPEVTADAALLVSPEDPEGMAAAIRKVLVDEKLREEMIVKGRSRVSGFTWEKTAKETLEVYRKAASIKNLKQ